MTLRASPFQRPEIWEEGGEVERELGQASEPAGAAVTNEITRSYGTTAPNGTASATSLQYLESLKAPSIAPGSREVSCVEKGGIGVETNQVRAPQLA